MGNVWTVARQTIAEGVRMKIAVFFIVVLVVLLLGLPFVSKGDGSVSGAIQSFLSYSVTCVTFLLSCLTIFLSKSISDDLTGKQILTLMSKPLGRWQYIVGKWLGIVLLNLAILILSGGAIYGMTRYIATYPPLDEWDQERLANQVLTARHSSPFVVPDFKPDANALYEQYLEEGRYLTAPNHNPEKEKERLRGELDRRWRAVWPGEFREFEFKDVRCPRTEDQTVHVQYQARVLSYPPDEILRCQWYFGNRAKGTDLYYVPRRDVIERKHTIPVPANVIADDNTLTAVFVNVNPYIDVGEVQYHNSVVFEGDRGAEVLFPVSSFESNLVRALSLVMCRLVFLAAVGVLATSVFSFPVACLLALTVYTMATMHGFLDSALEYMDVEDSAALDMFRIVLQQLLYGVYFVIPDFTKVNGLELLVDGRNVTLLWVLHGFGKLVMIQSMILLAVACLIFQRREVSEVSV